MTDDVTLIKNIIQYCDRIKDAVDRFGNDEEDFIRDPHYHDVCSFYITQIGESIRSLSPELTKKYTDIHWRGLVGMRNIIAHAYGDVDLEIIWVTTADEIPALKETCKKILKELGSS